MTCTVCPNCGIDLERFQAVHVGDLDVETHEVRWRGQAVPLRPSGRLFVSTVVRADGLTVSRSALSEALGCDDSENPDNLVNVFACQTRKAFRSIDPSFAALQNVWGKGYRWAA